MKIAAAILAWNEEASIGAMIDSLTTQSLLAKVDGTAMSLEILVVPNGCTDGTAAAARAALERLRLKWPAVTAAVHELSTPGKANAWNEFVHRLSDPGADYFLFLDADIELRGDDTLWNLVDTLETNRHAKISTDRPIKHLELKPVRGPLDRLLLRAGDMTGAAPGQLTGQLYCARASALRQLVIPRGLIVEDGFIKQMICTDGYRQAVDQTLVVRAPDAAHIFECYTRPSDVFNHQVRQAVGQTIYSYVRDDLKRCGRPVFEELRSRSAADPDWLQHVIHAELSRRGWWVMDTSSIAMRWRRIRFAKSLRQRAAFTALALAALAIDIPVFAVSNWKLRTGRINGIWKNTVNREVGRTAA